MNARNIILLVVAVVAVFLVVFVTRQFLEGQQQQAQPAQTAIEKASILVAARKLPRGTILTAKDFAWQDWPENAINELYLRKKNTKLTDMEGKVVRDTVNAATPITNSAVVAMGQRGYMAAILSPGMRAVTIKINSIQGVGGFIFPGDRVDILLTQNVQDSTPRKGETYNVTETILKNVRILGIDTRTEKGENVARPGKSVTVEVTPKIAEKLSIVPRLGALSLALRPLAQEGEPEGNIIETAVLNRAYTESAEISQFQDKFDTKEDEEVRKKNTVTIRRGASMRQMEIERAQQSKVNRQQAVNDALKAVGSAMGKEIGEELVDDILTDDVAGETTDGGAKQ